MASAADAANIKRMSSRCSVVFRRLRRRFIVTLVAAGFAALLLAAVAGACVAVAVRFSDHPAYARAVVRFSGGTIGMGHVQATDPNPFDGSAALLVSRAGIGTRVTTARALGVTLRISARTGALRISLATARHRFKYLSYVVIGGKQLVIDMWKSAPPSKSAEIRRGLAGCLTMDRSSVTAGLVSASGHGRGIFETSSRSFSAAVTAQSSPSGRCGCAVAGGVDSSRTTRVVLSRARLRRSRHPLRTAR
ncbi:MAG: hypothetical protein ACXVFQ_02010 [Solirubrobacteraceae bacterium]